MTRGEILFGIKGAKTGVTEEKRAEYWAIFQKLDEDKNVPFHPSFFAFLCPLLTQRLALQGMIDIDEMRGCLKQLGREIHEEDLAKLMKQLDTKGKGGIDFNDFLTLFQE
jgi:Ca2+-binding EF-hand superfamily protein